MISNCKYLVMFVIALGATSIWAEESIVDLCEHRNWKRLDDAELSPAAVTATQPDGMTALHWAVYHERLPAVETLLNAGADPNVENAYGMTPLAIGCQNGDVETVSRLLDAGADHEHELAGGETMLMRAARTGHPEVVARLLDVGGDVSATERRGQTALMWAAAEGHTDVVDQLIAAGAEVDTRAKSGFTAMFFAARNGRLEVCKNLIASGVDVGDTIRPASTSGRNPRARMSALMFAVESGHFELALKLVELGANPNDQRSGFAPLHAMSWVRRARRGDGVDGDPEPQGRGEIGSLAFVRQLVAAGADVNLKLERGRGGKAQLNPKGCTPFIMACKTADLPFMKVLIEVGADPTLTNAEGCTALMAASGIGIKSLVDEDPGSEVEVIDAVKYLIALGLDINAVDKNGETSMHGAAYRNYPNEVRFLFHSGADAAVWNRPNKHGWTPLDIAHGKRPGAFKPSPVTSRAIEEVLAETAGSKK